MSDTIRLGANNEPLARYRKHLGGIATSTFGLISALPPIILRLSDSLRPRVCRLRPFGGGSASLPNVSTAVGCVFSVALAAQRGGMSRRWVYLFCSAGFV